MSDRSLSPENDFPKAYFPAVFESSLYSLWEESGAFSPLKDPGKPTFSMIMPPPNANGNLHAGHALNITLQDIMARYHRLKGERVLWVPGSDHAGIETQVVFEKKLEKEGRSRFQMTREQFYKEVMAFTQENKANMEAQIRHLGASCDWSGKSFPLDKEIIEQVYATFRKMYEDGLIYRGERIVNYSVKYQTAYSEIEVVHEERIDPLVYLKYGPLIVATVRPETTFGDVAIAVHPDDPRYQKYHGKKVKVTLATGEIRELPIIADPFVDPKFGTGAVKITPSHDPNDFEMAQRHNLPLISVINTQGKMTEAAGEFAGLKVLEARKAVLEKLQSLGLVDKIDQNYKHSVALCYKSNTLIEPLVMPQWYIKVEPLKKLAIAAIEKGEITYSPANYKKVQLDWLRGLKDWNISRQIWWGIAIKDAFPEILAVAEDEDTFDTWFSSSQWPYMVLEAISKRKDDGRDYLKEFYPTDVMSTARDIIFAWVTRMVMLGLYRYQEVPFRHVYLHGMVLDKNGKKMSKSKGNVVNPIELAEKYGTDALRFGLTVGTSAGQDIPLPEEKIVGGRNFANKLWNIARFIYLEKAGRDFETSYQPQTVADKFILKELDKIIIETGGHIEKFRFALALQNLQEFVWHQLADIYLEEAKSQLDEQGQVNSNTLCILLTIIHKILIVLHPFIPFVTEAIYQQMFEDQGLLIKQTWPEVKEKK
jgi:valyl-tRNA synthetase